MNTVQREITVDQTPLWDLSQMVLEMNDVVAREMRERRRMVLGEESPRQLMQVVPCSTFRNLIDRGNSVLVIEHNIQLIEAADHVIDLGPEGGDGGGELIAVGTPEEIAANERSITGRYLARVPATA